MIFTDILCCIAIAVTTNSNKMRINMGSLHQPVLHLEKLSLSANADINADKFPITCLQNMISISQEQDAIKSFKNKTNKEI